MPPWSANPLSLVQWFSARLCFEAICSTDSANSPLPVVLVGSSFWGGILSFCPFYRAFSSSSFSFVLVAVEAWRLLNLILHEEHDLMNRLCFLHFSKCHCSLAVCFCFSNYKNVYLHPSDCNPCWRGRRKDNRELSSHHISISIITQHLFCVPFPKS